MNTQRVNGAAGVILAALQQNRTPAGIAMALEAAGLLMSPEVAADMASVSADAVRVAEESVTELRREHEESARLRQENAARAASEEILQRQIDAQAQEIDRLRTVEDRGETGTFAAWLHQRFVPGAQDWDGLSEDVRSYWEHQARAVQRAVKRGGFKAPRPAVEDVSPQVQKLQNLLSGQRAALEGEHYLSVHHTYRTPRDLPEIGGAL